MKKTCKCCHKEYETNYTKSVFCSEPCKTFYQTVGKKLSPDMLQDAQIVSTEDDYRLFIKSYFYMKNGKLNYQLLSSPMLVKHLKVDPLMYSRIHNKQDSINAQVLVWLYNLQPKQCITCNNATGLDIIKSVPFFRSYCSEACYTESMKSGGKARKVLNEIVVERHQVKNVFQLETVKEKSKATMVERFGVQYPMESGKLRSKQAKSLYEKYGVTTPMKSEIIKNRMFNTMGARCWYDTPEGKMARFKAFATYVGGHPMRDPKILSKMMLNFSLQSTPEREICEWLTSVGVKHITSSFSLLSGMKYEDGSFHRQIDIYCPDHNLAIEFNGTYWHSEIHKYRNYHVEKTNACESKGIQLVHIWEDEWEFNPDIVKGLLMAKLGIKKPTGYARQCYVSEGSNTDIPALLNSSHIQGSVPSASHYLLLRNKKDNSVRAVMTFMKRTVKGEQCMELTRFASDGVHGAFSKLLAYYTKHLQNGVKTFSFGDRSVVSRLSNVYLSHGFVETEIQPPDYKYHKPGTSKRIHKFSFRKSEFAKLGYDITGKTEDMLAAEAGLVRIWGCGLIRYELVQ